MDFFSNQQNTAPVVTASRHLDLALGRAGQSRAGLAVPENILLAITPADLRVIRRLLELESAERITIGGARLYRPSPTGHDSLSLVLDLASQPASNNRWALVGPAVSAPVAAAVLENLAAAGARRVVALGWCGSLQPDLVTGSLVVPSWTIREEGTSFHYLPPDIVPAADPGLAAGLLQACSAAGATARAGGVWTTDALYREARAKVSAFAAQGVLAVEMEAAALFAVGQFLGLETAMLLVVSDELAGAEWRVGWEDGAFSVAQEQACRIAVDFCQCL